MELLPCPFCGSDNIQIYPTGYGHPPKFAVLCGGCQAEGPVDLGESGAVEQWNTRPREDALEARAGELETLIRRNFFADCLCAGCTDARIAFEKFGLDELQRSKL